MKPTIQQKLLATTIIMLTLLSFSSCGKREYSKKNRPDTTKVPTSDENRIFILNHTNIPDDWTLESTYAVTQKDIESFRKTLHPGIDEIINQHFKIDGQILRINYLYARTPQDAQEILDIMNKKQDAFTERRLRGITVHEFISPKKELRDQAKKLLNFTD